MWGPLPSRSGRKVFLFKTQSIIFAHFRKEKDIKDNYNPLFPKFQFPWTYHILSDAGPHHIQLVLSCGRWRVRRFLLQVSRHETSEFSLRLCWPNSLFVLLKWQAILSMRKYGSVSSQPLITTAPSKPNFTCRANSVLSLQKHTAICIFVCSCHAEYSLTCQICFLPCNMCTVVLIIYICNIMPVLLTYLLTYLLHGAESFLTSWLGCS